MPPLIWMRGFEGDGDQQNRTDRRRPRPEVVVGAVVRAARIERKISREVLAAAAGCAAGRLQDIEAGRARPGAGELYAISRFLCRPISYFFDLDNVPKDNGVMAH